MGRNNAVLGVSFILLFFTLAGIPPFGIFFVVDVSGPSLFGKKLAQYSDQLGLACRPLRLGLATLKHLRY